MEQLKTGMLKLFALVFGPSACLSPDLEVRNPTLFLLMSGMFGLISVIETLTA